jgi:hypothetical protein
MGPRHEQFRERIPRGCFAIDFGKSLAKRVGFRLILELALQNGSSLAAPSRA